MVRSEAETVSVEEPVPLGERVTVEGLRDAVGSAGDSPAVRLAGLT